MMKLILITYAIICIAFNTTVFAQIKDNFIKGVITLNNGEVFDGYINQPQLEKINKPVIFKSSLNDVDEKVYKISDVKQILLSTGAVYEQLNVKPPREDKEVAILASLIVKGKASLYESSYNQTFIYLIVIDGIAYWLQDDEMIDGKIIRYYFKNILSAVLNIHSNEVERISFSDKHIIAKVTQYNSALGLKNEIIEVKKGRPSFTILGLGGMYKNSVDNEFYFNVIKRFYFPSLNLNTSLNISASYIRRTYLDNSFAGIYYNFKPVQSQRSLYSIPIYMQHNIYNKHIRPYVFLGGNISYIKGEYDINGVKIKDVPEGFQQNFGLGVVLGGGLELDVSKKILVKAEYRYENFPHMIMLGLGYKFKR